ncbi:MAG TPA: LLM class F420-dependent oxidoreductase [Acidimicrobiales bacterium]|nr:LLM class F420-dependent oxidoreductase [Acidimicrobiales bacterium]
MKFGIALGRVNPKLFVDVTLEADRLGFESVWLPEHLVLPVTMTSSPFTGHDYPPIPPNVHVFDAFAYLSYLAGLTERVRLGTHVYNLALRHPFVAARAVQTLDVVSGGRLELGIGASWLAEEWAAAGLDFHTRGRRLDEALDVCTRLWSEDVVEHRGTFFDFDPVMFEPKPVQKPWPPIHVGGESDAALRRAARIGDGWIGITHTLESVRRPVARLAELRAEAGRGDLRFEVTLGGPVASRDDVARWTEAGVDRLIVAPWQRSREAIDGMRRFADTMLG